MSEDRLRDQPGIKLDLVSKALNRAGVAVGNEHEYYPPWERVRLLAEQRDYFTRQCDQARADYAAACSERDALIIQLAACRNALEAASPTLKHAAVDGSPDALATLDLIAQVLAPTQ